MRAQQQIVLTRRDGLPLSPQQNLPDLRNLCSTKRRTDGLIGQDGKDSGTTDRPPACPPARPYVSLAICFRFSGGSAVPPFTLPAPAGETGEGLRSFTLRLGRFDGFD